MKALFGFLIGTVVTYVSWNIQVMCTYASVLVFYAIYLFIYWTRASSTRFEIRWIMDLSFNPSSLKYQGFVCDRIQTRVPNPHNTSCTFTTKLEPDPCFMLFIKYRFWKYVDFLCLRALSTWASFVTLVSLNVYCMFILLYYYKIHIAKCWILIIWIF